jgi:hypothetical protein
LFCLQANRAHRRNASPADKPGVVPHFDPAFSLRLFEEVQRRFYITGFLGLASLSVPYPKTQPIVARNRNVIFLEIALGNMARPG